jgi:hypothetical protein
VPSNYASSPLQAKTQDASNNDDLLTDDASIDDDVTDEKIRPEDFVDDADMEKVRAVMQQRSLQAGIRAAMCQHKMEELDDLLFRQGVNMESTWLGMRSDAR